MLYLPTASKSSVGLLIQHRGSEHHGNVPYELEALMAKNKGGREVRKPKQEKKPKNAGAVTMKLDGSSKKGT
jgi:hypothetical protein